MITRTCLARTCLVLSLIVFFEIAAPPPEAAAQSPLADAASTDQPLVDSTPADQPAADQPEWTRYFGHQIRVLLESQDPERQERAMQFILRYAGQLRMEIDFAPAVPALFEVFERAEDEGLRLLALRALGTVGSEPTLRRLARGLPEERSDRVRTHTMRELTVHLQRSQSAR